MKDQIKQLATNAGFVLWEDEPWRPEAVVDWSSSYDNELERFAELIVRRCAAIAETAEPYRSHDLILKEFGLYETSQQSPAIRQYRAIAGEDQAAPRAEANP